MSVKDESEESRKEASVKGLLVDVTAALERNTRANTDFLPLLYSGIIRGLGTALGATLVVSLLIAALRPLAEVGLFEPLANEIIEKLDSRP